MKKSSRSGRSSSPKTVALILALSAALPAAHAANGKWKGLGSDGAWDKSANWTAIPGAIGTTNNTDNATFDINAPDNQPVLIDAGRNIRFLQFNATQDTSAGSFTIGETTGNALHFTSGGNLYMLAGVTGTNLTQTINAPLILEAASATTDGTFLIQNSSSTASNILRIGGTIQGGTTTGAITLHIRGGNPGGNIITGSIGDGGAAGGLAISKADGGAWTLAGDNSYSGGTALIGGQLNLNHTHALGTGSLKVSLNPGAIDNTSGAPITLTGYAGLIIENTLTFVGTNDLNLGSAPVTINGSRSISVSAGTLTLGGSLTDGGAANKGLSVLGEGVLALTGDNGEYAEALYLNGGTARLASATARTGGVIRMGNGGVLELTAASGNLVSSIGADAGQIGLSNAGGGGFSAYDANLSVDLGSSITWGTGQWFSTAALVFSSAQARGTLDFKSDINLNNTGGADLTRKFLVHDGAAAVDAILSGVLSNSNRAGSLLKEGGGTLLLSAANTYRGATLVNAGRLIVGATGSIASTSGVSIAAGATFQYENDTVGLANAVTFSETGGTFIYNSASAYTGGALTVGEGAVVGGDGVLGALTLNAGGKIAPGNSIGTLSLDNENLTWNGEAAEGIAQFTFELSLSDNTSDRLDLGTGQLLKGTGESFTFDFSGTGAEGMTYTLLSFEESFGFAREDFSYLNLAAGLTGTFILNANDLQFAVIPEPGAFGLALIGLFAMAAAGRSAKARTERASDGAGKTWNR